MTDPVGNYVTGDIRSVRAEWASRAGTLMSWARIVPVVARAWNADARQPAARVRL